MVCTAEQLAGEVSLTPGAVISGWFLEGFSLLGYTQTGVEDDRYLSIYVLRKARTNLFFFHLPKLGDPPRTSELIAPLYHPLPLRSPSLQVRSCGL